MVSPKVLIFILCFMSFQAIAQKPSANKKAQSAFLEANKALRLQQHEKAEQLLLEAVSHDQHFATAFQQLGDIYRKNEQYEKAIYPYQQVLSNDPSLTPLTHFGLGESLLFTGQYALAEEHLKKYGNANLSEKSRQLVNKYLADCAFSLANVNHGIPYSLNKLGPQINTVDDEYFPKLTADNKTIIFTRKTKNQENFYESTLINGQWTEAQKLMGDINSENFNEGAHCISPDGKYLFFTGCNWPNGLGSCDIYVSKQENGLWGAPHNLGSPINTRGWESQPAISADGKTLYFVSNRNGGIGGYDIYKSVLKDDGTWGVAQNLGPNINTPFDESAPYIHADNQTLYFASNGWPGFGRKDIFKSQQDSMGNWSEPQNLGSTINNFRDQMALHVSMNGRIGHLASQDSLGQQDIYTFALPDNTRPKTVAYIHGKIMDAQNREPLEARIQVTEILSNKIIFEDRSDYIDGGFLATLPLGSDYAVHIQREGYLFESQTYLLKDSSHADERFESEILLKRIEKGATGTLNNIYFAVNKFDLLPESTIDLQMLVYFLKMNPQICIEISGHTDNTGKAEANQTLSENRAKSVQHFLYQNGIEYNRITTKGYGQTAPIADNNTEEGKRLNRRTEFKVL